MNPNSYQRTVLKDLSDYMDCVNACPDLFKAWKAYWTAKDIAVGLGEGKKSVPGYRNTIVGVPHVCMKVPTGGGKTFMACTALRRIFDGLPSGRPKVVVWLVPSDSIWKQTVRNLSNPEHDYRIRLNQDFAGRVGVYTKDMLLSGQNFSPDTVREMLTVCVMTYSTIRIKNLNKDIRKVYQENGNLLSFARYFNNRELLLADTPETALIQVLRQLNPVVVVDESHNAESELSVEMLNRLNPAFVLDLTATPRSNSNIISYVDARELKKENMVKLPVIVFNRNSRQSVIQDAIRLRDNLESEAIAAEKAGGKYIRPIVLFQAQPRNSEDSETFDKIKAMLVDMGIPREQIAVKVDKIDELKNLDLLRRDCHIRYIITVNALKEGWDCPFAYILASLANRTSTVDVEQIVGRILRLPYATLHKAKLLNTSFVLTNSADFRTTLDRILKGLNNAGFSRKDYRIGNPEELSAPPAGPEPEQTPLQPVSVPEDDDFSDVNTEEVRRYLADGADSGVSGGTDLGEMLQQAGQEADNYNNAVNNASDDGFVGGELGDMLEQNGMQERFAKEASALLIPQFCLHTAPDLFGGEYELLEKENLSEGFSLAGQDAQISFELATGSMYQVDIEAEGEAVPKAKRTDKNESEYIRERLAQVPPEEKIQHCVTMISAHINRSDRLTEKDIKDYVRRIVTGMTEDELAAMDTSIPSYARKIEEKIKDLETAYREKVFERWLDSSKIVCARQYKLPAVITPPYTIDTIPKSLYEAEKNDMNPEERDLIDHVVSLDNVKWWHRIIERKCFQLNGFITHYPDFMVMTMSGRLVLIEFKGDDRDNSDSARKLKLGRKWQEAANQSAGASRYRYFMVFKNRDFGIDGAYTMDDFMQVMREL